MLQVQADAPLGVEEHWMDVAQEGRHVQSHGIGVCRNYCTQVAAADEVAALSRCSACTQPMTKSVTHITRTAATEEDGVGDVCEKTTTKGHR